MRKSWSWVRSRGVCAAGMAAAALFGLALLLVPPQGEQNPQPSALQGTATPTEHAPPAVTDPAWGRLARVEQRTLEPLKATWSTLTAEQQAKWRLVADRFQTRPRHVQRRLAARITEWASLSPEQRAHARLNFLELAKRYSPRQRKEQWQAYQRAKPDNGQVATGHARTMLVPPAFVQASPGATTVLLSQLFELPSFEEPAAHGEATRASPPVDEASAASVGAAPAVAGSAADLGRAEP